MNVNFKRLHPKATAPQYATQGAACFDIATVGESVWHPADENARIFDTGLAFEVPEDHVMLVFSRSGHGFKNGLRLSNCVGVIDSDYRGELKISLRADGFFDGRFEAGDRIAQGMILPVEQVQFIETTDLSETERGTGGFGSTGV